MPSNKACKLIALTAFGLLSADAIAEWATFKPDRVQILPTGNFALWSTGGSEFTNSCGLPTKPFRVEINQHGVNDTGVKSMLSISMTALAATKMIDISYYPEDNCRVDSVTLHGN